MHGHRRGFTPVSTVFRKSVRFFTINIFLINNKTFRVEIFLHIHYGMETDLYEITRRFERLHPRGEWNWPISCLNASETQERGFECLNGGSSMTIKHFLFLALNMKQLNFRHFNTNSKKFCETVNFFPKGAKTAPKRPILFCLVCQGVFGHFATIPDYFIRRFPKATDDSRRLSKMSED